MGFVAYVKNQFRTQVPTCFKLSLGRITKENPNLDIQYSIMSNNIARY